MKNKSGRGVGWRGVYQMLCCLPQEAKALDFSQTCTGHMVLSFSACCECVDIVTGELRQSKHKSDIL